MQSFQALLPDFSPRLRDIIWACKAWVRGYRNASVRKNGILFASEVGVTTQKWPLFARGRQVEESRWSAAEWSFARFLTLLLEALVLFLMD